MKTSNVARVSVSTDRQLLEEALRLAQTSDRRAVVEQALQDFVAIQRQRRMLDLFGDGMSEEYDYKAARRDAVS